MNGKPITLFSLLVFTAAPAGTSTPSEKAVVRKAGLAEHLFTASDQCRACHNRLTTRNGEDISIGTNWRAAMMSNSATDPYWQAGVRRETIEHPESAEAIEDVCSSCHMPMARFIVKHSGQKGEVFSNLAQGNTCRTPPISALAGDGISCSVCHQIKADNLGKKESFGAGFLVDTLMPKGKRTVFGPFDISAGNSHIMNSASGFSPEKASHIRESALCGSCHTLYTHALDRNGKIVAELPEQMPYLEWLYSDYAEVKNCQDCHMKQVDGEAAITAVLGVLRPDLKTHTFVGGNFLMLQMLSKNSSVLGLSALPAELNTAADASSALLADSSANVAVDTTAISVENDTVSCAVIIDNLTGHKLPTAYPSRRVWIHLSATDGRRNVVFESGRLNPDGSIAGNDNDEDSLRFEPHYEAISSSSQVQIYESIMAAPDSSVTTGLLNAASYLKDNRILPLGFTKATVPPDVAVRGSAAVDPDFEGGHDRIVYRFPKGKNEGALTITVELWYQPIGYRWANNLTSLSAFEPERFIAMYRDMDGRETAVLIASHEFNFFLPSVPQTGTRIEGDGK
ncbi:MAG: hypothetical protein JXA18_12105 [Chitinispirillaceae bacterium]|nr:hypothetical protein [Chitinispirillaceae bacterium]